MRTEQTFKFFGSRAKTAEALGIRAPSVYSWGEYPPPLRQIQIERVTRGKLKAEANVFCTREAA
jgi:DNA-binding transcriptional regulator YdaS (Cro superfamily)